MFYNWIFELVVFLILFSKRIKYFIIKFAFISIQLMNLFLNFFFIFGYPRNLSPSDLVERPLISEISSTVFVGNTNVVYYFEGQIENKNLKQNLSWPCLVDLSKIEMTIKKPSIYTIKIGVWSCSVFDPIGKWRKKP